MVEGYELDIFLEKVDPEFLCGICHKVLRWAMQIECGCRFCNGCIRNNLETTKSNHRRLCPVCNEKFDEQSGVNKDTYAICQLQNAVVHCTNKINGCSHQSKLKDLDGHLTECEYGSIDCLSRDSGCTARMLRKELGEHLSKGCQFRQAPCDYCEVHFQIKDLSIHETKCKASCRQCPNGCEKMVPEDKLNEHFLTYCVAQLVECLYHAYGCKVSCTRKDMKRHQEVAASDHLQLVTLWVEKAQLATQKAQHVLQELSNNLTIKENKVNDLNTQADNMRVSLRGNKTLLQKLQTMVAANTDKLDQMEPNVRQVATKDDVIKMKTTVIKPLQECQDRLDGRLKRLERGDASFPEVASSVRAGGLVSNARMIYVENQMEMHTVRLAEHELRFCIIETANYEGVLLWKIKDFARRKRDADSGKTLSIYSQPFYTSRYGYKMCARIYLNGDGLGKGTHVSLFFTVMRGEYDPLLPWPFRQKVTLMLLDQHSGRRHLSDSFRPDPKSSSFQRPLTEMNTASGCPLFVNQSVLKDATYVKDDVMFIKVIVDTTDLYGP